MSEKDEPIHPVDALVDAAKRAFPGREVDQASVDAWRAYCDEIVTKEEFQQAVTTLANNITPLPPSEWMGDEYLASQD